MKSNYRQFCIKFHKNRIKIEIPFFKKPLLKEDKFEGVEGRLLVSLEPRERDSKGLGGSSTSLPDKLDDIVDTELPHAGSTPMFSRICPINLSSIHPEVLDIPRQQCTSLKTMITELSCACIILTHSQPNYLFRVVFRYSPWVGGHELWALPSVLT